MPTDLKAAERIIELDAKATRGPWTRISGTSAADWDHAQAKTFTMEFLPNRFNDKQN